MGEAALDGLVWAVKSEREAGRCRGQLVTTILGPVLTWSATQCLASRPADPTGGSDEAGPRPKSGWTRWASPGACTPLAHAEVRHGTSLTVPKRIGNACAANMMRETYGKVRWGSWMKAASMSLR